MVFIDFDYVKDRFKPRDPESYKGDFGHTLILCGSYGMVGAGFFASMGAVKSGSGLTTLGTYSGTFNIFSIKLNEVMLINLDKVNIMEKLDKFSSIVFGCGFGINEKNKALLKKLLLKYKKPIVIDADGLSILSKNNNLDLLKERKFPTILTPHYGEFSRLTDLDIEYIKNNNAALAKEFAKKYNCILLLKDHRTVISDGKDIYINTTGNSVMATGGMGDILSGVIGSLISQKYSPIEAVTLATYFHGRAGEVFSKSHYCITPTLLLETLPKIIKETEF
ncbi:NAD(P)H-hydrate dehydratase [Cetobacterium somerae]|uniref:NAD(P)H-hydrate dehydratase n=1 Tax=Cetobacterium somerae TaxID=188913 RepID=UPI003D768EFA